MYALLLAAALATEAAAQPPAEAPPPPAEAPAQPAKPEEKDEVEDVVVTAEKPQVVTAIDRKTYDVKSDPAAQTLSGIEILEKLPSVTVGANGQVSLLGQPNVRILIDGKPPGQRDALRVLTGEDIERIEIMTNPSAEFGPQGGGGIINIITRKQRKAGWSGMAQVFADSQGGARVMVSPTLNTGPWTIGGALGFGPDRGEGGFERDRTVFLPGGPVRSFEQGDYEFQGDVAFANFNLAFRPDEESRYTVNLHGYKGSNTNESLSFVDYDPVPGFVDYEERNRGAGDFQGVVLDLGYEWTGKTRPGESFNTSWRIGDSNFDFSNRLEDDFVVGPDETYLTRSMTEDLNSTVKADYKRPLENKRLLSFGGQWEYQDTRLLRSFETVGGGPIPDQLSEITGVQNTLSGYVTYQFPLGNWKVLPGVRLEYDTIEVQSGPAAGENDAFDIYPSLHITREFKSGVEIRLSYSRRIDRPGLDQLDPALNYSSPTQAQRGNPGLEPVSIDSYEASMTYAKEGYGLAVTVYARESSGVWTQFSELTPAGVRISYPINAGTASNRGAEIQLRGPLWEGFRFSVTTNIYYREQEILVGGLRRPDGSVSYNGNVSLDWKGKTQPGGEAQQLQLQFRYVGPTQTFQGSNDAFFRADFTYRQPLTPKVTAVFWVSDIFDSSEQRFRVVTSTFEEEQANWGAGTTARFALIYRFGTARPGQGGGGSGGAPGMGGPPGVRPPGT